MPPKPENCTQAANMSKITADYPPPTHPKHPEKALPHGCRQRPAIISQSPSFSFPLPSENSVLYKNSLFIVLYHSATSIILSVWELTFCVVLILLHEHKDLRPGVQSANMCRPWCSGNNLLVNCRSYHGMSRHFTQFCGHCFSLEHLFLTYSIYALNRIYITRACDVTCSQLFSNGLKWCRLVISDFRHSNGVQPCIRI
jgi:hypothetical protein